jgi:phosphoglycolate phosphatase
LSPTLGRPRAAVFDLDGTLVDSVADIAAAVNHALAAEGRGALPVDAVRRFVGDGARLLVARAFAMAPDQVERPLARFHEHYLAHPCDRTTLMPGAIAALDALAGARVALVTNKPRGSTLLVLGALGIAERFAAIYAGGDGPLKPDPASIRAVLGEVPAASAWVIGDGAQDVGAGRAAGCVTVGVLGGYGDVERLRASAPDVLLASLEELPALLATAG